VKSDAFYALFFYHMTPMQRTRIVQYMLWSGVCLCVWCRASRGPSAAVEPLVKHKTTSHYGSNQLHVAWLL